MKALLILVCILCGIIYLLMLAGFSFPIATAITLIAPILTGRYVLRIAQTVEVFIKFPRNYPDPLTLEPCDGFMPARLAMPDPAPPDLRRFNLSPIGCEVTKNAKMVHSFWLPEDELISVRCTIQLAPLVDWHYWLSTRLPDGKFVNTTNHPILVMGQDMIEYELHAFSDIAELLEIHRKRIAGKEALPYTRKNFEQIQLEETKAFNQKMIDKGILFLHNGKLKYTWKWRMIASWRAGKSVELWSAAAKFKKHKREQKETPAALAHAATVDSPPASERVAPLVEDLAPHEPAHEPPLQEHPSSDGSGVLIYHQARFDNAGKKLLLQLVGLNLLMAFITALASYRLYSIMSNSIREFLSTNWLHDAGIARQVALALWESGLPSEILGAIAHLLIALLLFRPGRYSAGIAIGVATITLVSFLAPGIGWLSGIVGLFTIITLWGKRARSAIDYVIQQRVAKRNEFPSSAK